MSQSAEALPALICTDWRSWSSHRIAPLLEREIERWARDFHWDQRWSFTHIEAARESGRLPGLVATGADGVPHGWTFFLRHRDQFQIGMVVSDGASATRALVDAALRSPLASDAAIVVFSPDTAGLVDVLDAHAVRSEPYDYLTLSDAPMQPDRTGRPVAASDLPKIAELAGEAYRETSFLRPFVPGGDADEWQEYIGQLVATRGCGEFLSDASVVIDEDATPGALAGALVATQLSHDTGHIAQVVVSRHARGRGLARRMLSQSLAAMRHRGLRRASLLVARTNLAARRLYDDIGFQPTGTFITGIR